MKRPVGATAVGRLPEIVLLVVLLCMPLAASRAATIDRFEDFGTSSTLMVVGSGSSSGVGGLGGTTDGIFSYLSGTGAFHYGVNSGSVGSEGYLFGAVESLNTASIELQWDGGGEPSSDDVVPAGLGSVDLTDAGAADAVLVAIAFNDGQTVFTMTVHTTGGTRSSTIALTLPPVATPAILAIPFADFTGDADFADASAVVVVLDLAFGADILIDGIETGDAASGATLPPGFPSPGAPVAVPPGSFVIEDFSAPSSSGVALGPGGSSATGLANAPSLGGNLAIAFENLAGSGSLEAARDGNDGQLRLHGTALASGRATVFWDGSTSTPVDTAGLGSVDLTSGGTHDRFLFGHNFGDVATAITFRVHSNGGAALSTGVLPIPAFEQAGNLHEIPFSAFTGTADFTQVSALELEIDWRLGLDFTADFLATGDALPRPDLEVQGNGVAIVDGDATPRAADHTDFGLLAVGAFVERTFTLINDGDLDANLGPPPPVSISGSGAFTIEVQPTTPLPSGGGSTTFVVRFTPTTSGLFTATVSIGSDDADESPYTFAVRARAGDVSVADVPALGSAGLAFLIALLAAVARAALAPMRSRPG